MKTKTAPTLASTRSTPTTKKITSRPYFKKSVQPKLKTGQKGDKYEMEADRMADAVVNGQPKDQELTITTNGIQKSGLFGQITKGVQLQEEDVQPKEEEEIQREPEEVQTKKEEEKIQKEGEEELQLKMEEEALQKEESEELQTRSEEEVQTKKEKEELQKKEDELEVQKEGKEEALQKEENEQGANETELEVQKEGEDEALQTENQDEIQEQEDEKVQQAGDSDGSFVDDTVSTQIKQQQGIGSPLPETVKAKMENQFRADFSGVTIHTDDTAVVLAQMLNAKAFTHGSDVYFNKDQFKPNTRDGDHLLAHELTHTIHQGAVSEKEEQVIQLEETEGEGYLIRPEILKAISIARGEIGKINSKLINADKTRIGWEKLYQIFFTAFGNKEVIPEQVIKYITMTSVGGKTKDALPSWCGIFVWWALKKAGVPLPDWKLGENILQHTIPRKPGELPRKGDIAFDFKPNQHFAMVTGVEDPASAAGKSYNDIMVATINGNTAGNDNLGGQVEEKWEPIGKWRQDHASGFMDPIGKLNMPDVPLVQTAVTPDEESEVPSPVSEEQVPTEEEMASEAEKQQQLDDLENQDITTIPDAPAEGETVIAVELPPLPQVTDTEEVAEIEALDLEGSSDEAMVKFTMAGPSQIAENYSGLGGELEGKVNNEKKEIADNPPKIEVRTSGTLDEGIVPPDQLGLPAGQEISDGSSGNDPGDLQATPHEDKGPVPTNKENEKLLDKNDNEGFLGWLKNNMASFMAKIRTTDQGVNTSAGSRPNVELEGDADPERMKNQRSEADSQITGQRDVVTDKLKNHPGQSNVQPKEVNAEKTTTVNGEPTAEVLTEEQSSLNDFAEAPLPKNVRSKADEMMQPGLHANLDEAKKNAQDAGNKRDTDKQAEITHAESEAKKTSESADKEQRKIVLDNRKTIADKQKKGIEDAYGHVNEFKKDADTEQTNNNKEIGEKVKTSEADAKKELEAGEKKAEDKKKEKEKEAADKKKELEKDQKKDSWWDRVKSAVKKAVKVITDAIDTIFTALRKAVADIIKAAKDLAIGLINKARNWIVDKLNKFRDWAKSQVDKYLKEHFPGLAKAINDGIDSVVDTAIDGVNFVADEAIKAVEKLAAALAAALDKILSVYQEALKAAVRIAGAVATGDFAEALKIAIQAACDIAGIDSQPIFDFIDKAKNLIMDILKDPKSFLNNVMAAVGGGVRGFFKNIKQHLISGLIEWLTGTLSETSIKLPETFDIMGIFDMVMQILGLTYANIKARIIKKFPPAEKVFYVVEEGLAIIKRVFDEGPQVLWEIVKEKLANLKEMVMGAIKDYIIKTVVFEGITWLLGLLNPAGALVKILKLAFDLIMWLVEKFQQIIDFVKSVYDSVAAIASGQIGAASKAVEDAMARSLPVLISMLAAMAGLGGIGQTIQKLIQKVTDPINKIIDGLIDKGIALVKKFLKSGKDVAKKVKDKLINWWKAKKSFKGNDGKQHKLYFSGEGKSAKLMVASNPGPYATFLGKVETGTDNDKINAKKEAVRIADEIFKLQQKHIGVKDEAEKKKQEEDRAKAIQNLLVELSKHTEKLFGSEMPESDVKHDKKSEGGADQGKLVDAKILTKKLPKQGTTGSVPDSSKNKVFDKLNYRRSGKGSYYVKGHLLNHNLHGPGKWFNMVPLSRKGNSNHEKQVESKVKKAVLKKGEVVRYKVIPTGGYPKFAPKSEELKKKNVPLSTIEKMEAVGEAEQYVPRGLQCEAVVLEEKDGKWVGKETLYNGTVLNPVEQTESKYKIKT